MPRSSVSILAALATLTLLGCGDSSQPSIVLVTVDTLRADRLGCAGHTSAATPNIDDLARRGTYFRSGVSHVPITLPSHASLFTGLIPPSHRVRDNTPYALSDTHKTLSEVLRESGWQTAAFIGAQPLAPGCGLEQGFDTYDFDIPFAVAGQHTLSERRADEVTDAAIEWLRTEAESPFFLWVHYFDPHAPYDPAADIAPRFATSPYDGEIATVDRELGRLFKEVRAHVPSDDLIEVFCSDHGEGLGDHGEATHSYFVYESTIEVPIIFAGQGIPIAPSPDERPARIIDIMPTLLDLLGIEGPSTQGVSLFKEDPGPAYSESLYTDIHFGWSQLSALRSGDLKYIDGGNEQRLFDLKKDPGELTNLLETNDVPEDMIRELRRWRESESSVVEVPPTLPPIPGYLSLPESPLPKALSPSENRARRSPLAHARLIEQFDAAMSAALANHPGTATRAFEQLLAQDAENPTFLFWAGRAYREQAGVLNRPEDLKRAVELFDAAVSRAPGHLAAFNLSIQCLSLMGRFEEAYDRAIGALRTGRGDGRTEELLGRLLLTRRSKSGRTNPYWNQQEGIAHLESAIERLPSPLRALQALGNAYREAGLSERAEEIRRRVEALESQS